MVEHAAVNRVVVGSSPTSGANPCHRKMVETKGERASFLSKEVRRIAFSEITKNDLP